MRIISGQFKGRRFDPSGKISARPTTDFAKEGLFNVLSNRIDFESTAVLDLFAGIGSISIELASRGCPSITSVEISQQHIRFIRKVISELNINSVHIIQTDVFKFIKSTSLRFDLIFADPPYELKGLKDIPDLIFEHQLLKENGLFILEHPKKINFSNHPHFLEHRFYGNVNFSFFS